MTVPLALVAGALGAALGGALFAGAPAEAQARFTTCFGGIQEVVDINDSGEVQMPQRNRMIQVPAGWTVVGSGGGSNENHRDIFVLFCR
ncbi:MAG: hypothetical protein KF729_25765 [Sandaracinaceae bacterium]|nr:hypothetical protein [Sandaracinaceae bacterium]